MRKKRFTTEQIISMLREAEVELSKGKPAAQVIRALGISDQTYYRWRREYGGLESDQARRFKDVEKENSRLKRIVADQALDIVVLKEVASGNF